METDEVGLIESQKEKRGILRKESGSSWRGGRTVARGPQKGGGVKNLCSQRHMNFGEGRWREWEPHTTVPTISVGSDYE